jgi:hypothetical protein
MRCGWRRVEHQFCPAASECPVFNESETEHQRSSRANDRCRISVGVGPLSQHPGVSQRRAPRSALSPGRIRVACDRGCARQPGLHRSISTRSASLASAAGARHCGNGVRTFGIAPRLEDFRQLAAGHAALDKEKDHAARFHDERPGSANVTCHCPSISFACFHFNKSGIKAPKRNPVRRIKMPSTRLGSGNFTARGDRDPCACDA